MIQKTQKQEFIAVQDKFFDHNARIEKILFLAGMMADGYSASDELTDFLEDDSETVLKCFPDMPVWLAEEIEDEMDTNQFLEWMQDAGKLGFLVKMATPVMEHNLDAAFSSFHWGHYYTDWFYGDSMEEAIQKGFAWTEERRAQEKIKAAAGS